MAKLQPFTIQVTRAGEPPKQRPNCIELPGGYVAMLRSEGRGKMTEAGAMNHYGEGETWEEWEYYEDVIQPLFDRALTDAAGMTETLRTAKTDLASCQENGWMQYVLRLGNHNGVEVINLDAVREQQFLADRAVAFQAWPCWETGITWYQMVGERVPDEVFKAMRPLLTYHAEQVEEEGNWRGWCIDHHGKMPDLEAALARVGWRVKYANR